MASRSEEKKLPLLSVSSLINKWSPTVNKDTDNNGGYVIDNQN